MSDSISAVTSELYDYSLVLFVHRGRRRQVEKIHIVPTKWLSLTNKKLFTSFIEDPIEEEDLRSLVELTKNKGDAPADWSLFRVKIVGRANDYTEACNKLEQLQTKESVLTCYSDEDVEATQNRIVDALKQRDLLKAQDDLCKRMNVDLVPEVVANESITAKDQTEVSTENLFDEEEIKTIDISEVPHKKEKQVDTVIALEKYDAVVPHLEPSNSVMNVSVLDITSSYQCKNGFEQAVMDQFLQLRVEYSELSNRLERIENFLMDKRVVSMSKKKVDFKENYNLKLPLDTTAEFTNFNNDLKTQKFLKHDVLSDLHSLVNIDGSITKSYVKMLKKFCTKSLATNFTAARKGTNPSKIILKNTEFCNSMDVVIISKRKHINKETEEKDLVSGLSDVLCNVKNWKADPVETTVTT